MGYAHIDNLYKNQEILMFKRCYAMEKIHGTSAYITLNRDGDIVSCGFSSGGAKLEEFTKIFDKNKLFEKFRESNISKLTIFGEAYGGKMQGMSHIYGKSLKFVAFDVLLGNKWLDVPQAEKIVLDLGLEFVYYKEIDATVEAIDVEKMADSVQAVRNGMGTGHMREGVVVRPLRNLIKNNGERIVAKHKRDEFMETQNPRKVESLEKLKKIEDAKQIAEEWVTVNRLEHVLDKMKADGLIIEIELTKEVIKRMIEDVIREGKDEIVENKMVNKEIGNKTAFLFKRYLNCQKKEDAQ